MLLPPVSSGTDQDKFTDVAVGSPVSLGAPGIPGTTGPEVAKSSVHREMPALLLAQRRMK